MMTQLSQEGENSGDSGRTKAPPVYGLLERGKATRAALRRVKGRGEMDSPNHRVHRTTMNADECTPRSGENVSGESFDYQSVGQTLLRWELERVAYDIRGEFQRASAKLNRGEELNREDWVSLKDSVERANILVGAIGDGVGVGDDGAQLVEESEEVSE